MNRRFIFKNFMLALVLTFSTLSLSAALFTVDSTTDDGTGGLTLREAVADALANADASDVIEFAASTNGNTISLTGGEILINLAAGEDLTITGNGFTNTIVNGTNSSRIFNVSGDATAVLNINDIRLRNGATTMSGGAIFIMDTPVNISGSQIRGSSADMNGGGIWTNADLFISDTRITGNTASGDGGGGIYNDDAIVTITSDSRINNNTADGASGSGGGIFNDGGLLVDGDSRINNNVANRAGGGIESRDGTITILDNFRLNGNNAGVAPDAIAAPGNGGGLHITGAGDAVIENGVVNNNVAASEGGGLWNGTGLMEIDGTTISGNTASGDAADNGGGGIFNAGGIVDILGNNLTIISDNVADGSAGSGGGVFNDGGLLNATFCDIIFNTANRAGGGIEASVGADNNLNDVFLNNNNVGVAPAIANPGNGGGMHITGFGSATITNCFVNGNTAASEGGGLWNGIGTMDIDATDIDSNIASGDDATNGGGGIFNAGGTVNIGVNVPVDITNNVADGTSGSGGGIFNDAGGIVRVMNFGNISFNTANRAGGGVEATAGTLTELVFIFMEGNNAGVAPAVANPGNGGAMHITGNGDANLIVGVVDNVAASEGGGLWNGTGTMTIDFSFIEDNTASGDGADQGGGGIFNAGGTVHIINTSGPTEIIGNIADGTAGSGGGILNDAGGTVIISDALIRLNQANRAGGGIEVTAGTTNTLTNVTLNNNNAGVAPAVANPGNGGGMHISGAGNVTITGGTNNNNIAASEGGGLWNGTGTMTLDNTRVNNNTASGNDATNGGGGIFNAGGTVEVTNDTRVNQNIADGTSGSGGGIFNDASGILNITGSRVNRNVANRAGGGIETTAGTTVTIDNSRLVENNAGVAPDAIAAPGNGGGLHVSGNGTVDVVNGSVVLDNVADREGGGLWNGSGVMTVEDSNIDNNTASGSTGADDGGGGIFNNGGTLNVTSSNIRGNVADGTAGSGGGILNLGGILTVTGGEISGNTAVRAGGGIEDNSTGTAGSVTLTNLDLLNNNTGASPGNGGGLHMTGPGTSDIIGGLVDGNTAAAEGGGLWNGSGIMTVNGTTVSNNTASGTALAEGGGGIFNAGGTVNISNATISGNDADGVTAGSGGGILNDAGGSLTVTDTEISGNTSQRAGGGIEDNSSIATGSVTLTNVDLLNNETGPTPGNGGGLHMTGPGASDITGGIVNLNIAASEGGGLWNGTGTMTVDGTEVSENTASGLTSTEGGGGLFNAGGTLNISNAEIFSNTADGTAGSGGGILNDAGTLTVDESAIFFNGSTRAGGGIEATAGSMTTLTDVGLDLNDAGNAPGNGGGMHITGAGDADITGGNVGGNTAEEGGGLWNGSGTMNVTEVTVAGNTASRDAVDTGGGGLFNNGGTLNISRSTVSSNNTTGLTASGGGVHSENGLTTVEYSTISGNSTLGNGGGVFGNGDVNVVASTITDNTANGNGGGIAQTSNTATVGSSIVAVNFAAAGQDIAGMGTFTSADYNLIGEDDLTLFTSAGNDLIGVGGSPIDPLLNPLADNGGPTFTHELNCASPAIDAGDPGNSSPDQRNIAIAGGQRDIGAFERDSTPQPNLANTGLVSSDNNENVYIIEVCGGTMPYSFEFTTATGAAFIDPQPSPLPGCIRYQVVYAVGEEWTLTVTDAEGCTNKDVIFTEGGVPSAPVVQVVGEPATTPENCYDKDGTFTITIEGGDDTCSDYTYSYTGPDSGSGSFTAPTGGGTSDLVVTDLIKGVYQVTITDCAGTSIEVTVGIQRLTTNGSRGRRGCRGKAAIDGTLLETMKVYPNPFETSTTVEFSLIESSNVVAAIFTMDGREVAKVFEGEAEAGQVYSLPFNAENLPTGMYVLQVTTDSGTTHHEKLYIAK